MSDTGSPNTHACAVLDHGAPRSFVRRARALTETSATPTTKIVRTTSFDLQWRVLVINTEKGVAISTNAVLFPGGTAVGRMMPPLIGR